MPLQHTYRPSKWEEVIGNTQVVSALRLAVAREQDRPHSYLITGPAGTGKTTLGRIIAKSLGAAGMDLIELNAADFRGIDMVRELRNKARLKPMTGGVRCWILDECFVAGTKVRAVDGDRDIEDIRVGDMVYSLYGPRMVERTFVKDIPIQRVVSVYLQDGTVIRCSDGHLFMTRRGWVPASLLTEKDVTFSVGPYIMPAIASKKECEYACKKNMSGLRGIDKVGKEPPGKMEEGPVLFEEMPDSKQVPDPLSSLSVLCGTDSLLSREEELQGQLDLLQHVVCTKTQIDKTGIPIKTLQCRNPQKDIDLPPAIQSNRKGEGAGSPVFSKDAKKQSDADARGVGKNTKHQTTERQSACLEGAPRRQRDNHRSSTVVGVGVGMGNGSSGRTIARRAAKWISDKLQSGRSQPDAENRHRGGWPQSSMERGEVQRQEERGQIKGVRVDRVEVYQSRGDGQSGGGAFDHSAKDGQTLKLYDLQIAGHPSYYAEGILVHNCHQLSSDAQEAALKLLEEPPEHAFFCLATTEPHKLKPTLLRRCHHAELQPLSVAELSTLLKKVWKKEMKEEPVAAVVQMIASIANGSPGMALSILDRVIETDPEDMLKVVETAAAQVNQSIELCRLLLKGTKWKQISTVLRGLQQEDAEKVRQHVMAYAKSCLLNRDDPRCGLILCTLRDNHPGFGVQWPALVGSFYEICCD